MIESLLCMLASFHRVFISCYKSSSAAQSTVLLPPIPMYNNPDQFVNSFLFSFFFSFTNFRFKIFIFTEYDKYFTLLCTWITRNMTFIKFVVTVTDNMEKSFID